MESTTKILFVEHDENDVELLQYTLRKGGIHFIAEVARNEKEYLLAMEHFVPDIILADYAFPSFNGQRAFQLKEMQFPEVPFLLVSGTVGEEKSIELIKSGVTDFVFKDKLFTLVTKVNRALNEANEKKIIKNTEADLKKSEKKYRQIVEYAHEGIWLTDKDGCTTFVNSAITVLLGYESEEMSGKPHLFFIAENWKDLFSKWLNEGDFEGNKGIEIKFVSKSKMDVWAFVTANSVKDEEGHQHGFLTMLTNITERKKNEALVKSSDERYRVLFEQNLAGIYISTLSGEILTCNDMFAQMLKYESTKELIGQNVFDFYCSQEQKSQVLLAFAHHENISNGEHELCCKDGTKIWVIKNVSIRAEQSEHHFLCDGIVVDITERKRAEEQMRWLINNTEESFILLDRQLNIISFNDQAFKSYFSYLGQKLVLGNYIMDYAVSKDHTALNEIYRRVLEGNEESSELSLPVEGKQDKNFVLKYKPATDDNDEVIGVFVSIVDVSERKIAQLQKEFETRDKEALINNTTDLIWSITRDYKLIAANFAFTESLRQSVGVEIKRGDELMLEGKYPAEFLLLWESFYLRALNGESFIEEIYTPAWGEFAESWAETRFNPIYDGSEITGVACYTRDTTASKYYSTNLLEINKKLVTAQQIAQLGYWEWNIETDTLFWSTEVYKIWGVSEKDFTVTNENFFESIYRDDKPIFELHREFALNGKGKLDVEHRIVLPDGSLKYVHERGELAYNVNGVPIKFEGTVQDITARKKVDAEIKELANRLSLATTSAGLGIWEWNITNDSIGWDDEMFRIYGLNAGQFGASYEAWIALIHPDDRAGVMEKLQHAVSGNKEYSTEFRFIGPDQTLRYIKATGMTERNAEGKAIRMIGTNWDITLQKESEQQLKLLESVITNTTDAVLITDAEPLDGTSLKIVYVNNAFTKMSGYNAEEVLGKNPRILQGPKSDHLELEKLRMAMKQWQSCEITTINYKKNGEEFWINFSISPVANKEGYFTHWIAIERDITERKLSEIQLKELNRSLQIQSRDLAISNAALEQFAYVASHDLQEPLRMVTSFLKMIKNKYANLIDKKGNTYIDFAMDGAVRMRQIILDLLEFSRIGINETLTEDVDLNIVIDEIRQLYKLQIAEVGASVIAENLPVINGFITPLRQIFQNLVSNALKYRKAEVAPEVYITADDRNDHWLFTVKDNGIGIEEEYFEKIFVIFQRLHNSREYSGTGMGLALVKKIIDNNGGKIWLESELGAGSIFYFTLLKN